MLSLKKNVENHIELGITKKNAKQNVLIYHFWGCGAYLCLTFTQKKKSEDILPNFWTFIWKG